MTHIARTRAEARKELEVYYGDRHSPDAALTWLDSMPPELVVPPYNYIIYFAEPAHGLPHDYEDFYGRELETRWIPASDRLPSAKTLIHYCHKDRHGKWVVGTVMWVGAGQTRMFEQYEPYGEWYWKPVGPLPGEG